MLTFSLGTSCFFGVKPLLTLRELLIAFLRLALPLVQRGELAIKSLFLLEKTFLGSCELDKLRLLLFLDL